MIVRVSLCAREQLSPWYWHVEAARRDVVWLPHAAAPLSPMCNLQGRLDVVASRVLAATPLSFACVRLGQPQRSVHKKNGCVGWGQSTESALPHLRPQHTMAVIALHQQVAPGVCGLCGRSIRGEAVIHEPKSAWRHVVLVHTKTSCQRQPCCACGKWRVLRFELAVLG